MAVRKVKVILDTETAQFSVDLTGFNGKGCADVVKMFDGLGDKTKDIRKPEFKQLTCNTVSK